MTVYAPTDVRSINVSGGCGEHTAPADLPEGESMTVDCQVCEPLILATRLGWSQEQHGVELTPDERRRYEAAQQEAATKQALTWSDPAKLGESLRAAGLAFAAMPAAAPSLLDQLKALTAEEKDAVRDLLGPAPTSEPEETPDPEPAGKTPAKAPPKKSTPAKKTAASAKE